VREFETSLVYKYEQTQKSASGGGTQKRHDIEMTTTIYRTINTDLVKHVTETSKSHVPEFSIRRQDDPRFVWFVHKVNETASSFDSQPPADHKLFGLWFTTRTFQQHWQAATADTAKHMAWVCFMHRLTFVETGWVVLAWMHHHGRYPTADQLRTHLTALLRKVEKAVQPELHKVKNKRNEKRRERYNTMKTNTKRGRPKQTGPDTLHDRILDQLRQGRSTPRKLATDLEANVSTVSAQLRRLLAAGEVVKPDGCWGLYEIAEPHVNMPVFRQVMPRRDQVITCLSASPVTQAAPVITRSPALPPTEELSDRACRALAQMGITDGIADYKAPPVMDHFSVGFESDAANVEWIEEPDMMTALPTWEN
jgi:hypothetical protein